ncbi:hypothetical protein UFOVP48_42 [uncultured Caudovirales phage]|uniref:Uncharacterized protein n=1 Tax=uncultured Caudovirales phage TaxID=2100421 RepID=A0A6J5KP26_9CAUD|nr:hypothetical protein UFOVP48_42 [uncultured Caudovirales phage]
MNDSPNFAAWTPETLAKFATDAYVRMQEQQDALEQYQRDLKDAMAQLRKALWENSK